MRPLPLALALLGVSLPGCTPPPQTAPSERPPQSAQAPRQPERPRGFDTSDSDRILGRAFDNRANNLRVEGRGAVRRTLPDDNDGSRHQRFILELGSGQTLLVAHNVDVAPRVPDLQTGDEVEFRGEYEWSPQGGVIHWTHHDPEGRRPGGWLRHKGQTYR